MALAITTACVTVLPAMASAATTVDTSADPATPNCASGHPAGTCSLRGAVAADSTVVIATGIDPVLTMGEIGIGGDITITGQGARATTVSGNHASRTFNVSSGKVSISALTLTAGHASEGGALWNDPSGNVSLTDVAVTGSAADTFGGGILNRGTLTLLRVTLSHNTASSPSEGVGGGIANGGSANLTATNSTISNNTASAAGSLSVTGGGIYNNGSVTLTNVTLASNTVIATGTGTGSGGNITTVGVGASATLRNTVVAYGTAPTQSNCFGGAAFVSQGGNLETTSPSQCGLVAGTDKVGLDPLLGTLADNGGQTDTRALGAGSPAIDAVPGGNCPPPGDDQRQVARPQGLACDIGAFEVQAATQPPAVISMPPSRACVDTRKFKFLFHHDRSARVMRVRVYVNGVLRIDRRGRDIKRLTLRRLPQRRFTVKIVATQSSGTVLITRRTYHDCRKTRPRTTVRHLHHGR